MKAPILLLVVLVVGGDADHRKAERVLHVGIEVEQVVLVGQRRLLQIGDVPAVGVLLDERLPARAPGRRLAERAHDRRRDRPAVGIDPEIAAADEVEAGMVEIVVGPVVDRDALRRQPVPVVEVEREQRGDASRPCGGSCNAGRPGRRCWRARWGTASTSTAAAGARSRRCSRRAAPRRRAGNIPRRP